MVIVFWRLSISHRHSVAILHVPKVLSCNSHVFPSGNGQTIWRLITLCHWVQSWGVISQSPDDACENISNTNNQLMRQRRSKRVIANCSDMTDNNASNPNTSWWLTHFPLDRKTPQCKWKRKACGNKQRIYHTIEQRSTHSTKYSRITTILRIFWRHRWRPSCFIVNGMRHVNTRWIDFSREMSTTVHVKVTGIVCKSYNESVDSPIVQLLYGQMQQTTSFICCASAQLFWQPPRERDLCARHNSKVKWSKVLAE